LSWTGSTPITRRVRKLIQDGATKLVFALQDPDRYYWVSVFVFVSRMGSHITLSAYIYNSFGSDYAGSLHVSQVVEEALSSSSQKLEVDCLELDNEVRR
jgi:hypothetical protein